MTRTYVTVVAAGLCLPSLAGAQAIWQVKAKLQKPAYVCRYDGMTFWQGTLVEEWTNSTSKRQEVLEVTFTDYVLFKDAIKTTRDNIATSMIGDAYTGPMPSVRVKSHQSYKVMAEISIPFDADLDHKLKLVKGIYYLRFLTGATKHGYTTETELGYTYSDPVSIQIPEAAKPLPECSGTYKKPKPL